MLREKKEVAIEAIFWISMLLGIIGIVALVSAASAPKRQACSWQICDVKEDQLVLCSDAQEGSHLDLALFIQGWDEKAKAVKYKCNADKTKSKE